jgi:hypothetical protein
MQALDRLRCNRLKIDQSALYVVGLAAFGTKDKLNYRQFEGKNVKFCLNE